MESATGWHWTIEDGAGQMIDSAGNKNASKYEPEVEELDTVMEEGVQKFNALPCHRPISQPCL